MKGIPVAAAVLTTLLAASSCRPTQSDAAETGYGAELAARASRLAHALALPDSSAEGGATLARWLLPAELKEISGLALTADGRLFTHEDQNGKVWEIDYRRGTVVKEFSLGNPAIHGDFESIAIVGDKMFLLSSKGKLYEFREGTSGENVAYTIHDTELREVCELEGMASDTTTKSLLLACKHVFEEGLKDSLVIFRWKVDGETARGLDLPRLTVPLAQVTGANKWKTLRPSDITVDPQSGNYVLVASREKALIVITSKGVVVLARALPGEHEQAEGVAITKDSILLVSDEGSGGPGAIALYRWPLGRGR
jgi:uncharacterized protein YjiK